MSLIKKKMSQIKTVRRICSDTLLSGRWGQIGFFFGKIIHPKFPVLVSSFIRAFIIIIITRKKTIAVTWDYKVCNCKYGDYIFALTVARLIGTSGHKVVFIEIHNEKLKYFKSERDKSDNLFREFLADRVNLKYALKQENVSYWEGSYEDFMKEIAKRSDILILLRKYVIKRKYTIDYIHNIISPLFFWLSELHKIEFVKLLEPTERHKNQADGFATNFRYNPSRSFKDSDPAFFSRSISCLEPSAPFFICSDKIGYENFLSSFSSKNWFCHAHIEGSQSYLQDFCEVLNHSFYFQFSGGGMSAIVCVGSKLPYVIFQNCGHLVPWSYGKLFSFSFSNQHFFASEDKDHYLDVLRDLSSRCLGSTE